MNTIFALLLLFNIGLLALTASASRVSVFRNFTESALNPLVIYCLISVLINIDFITIYRFPAAIGFLETNSYVAPETVLNAYCVATLIALGGTIGLFGAVAMPAANAKTSSQPESDAASWLSAMIIGTVGVMGSFVAWAYSPKFPTEDLLSYQLVSRENPFVAIGSWLQPASLALPLGHMRRPISLAGVAFTVMSIIPLAAVGGVRVMPLVCLLVFVVCYASERKISALWYLPLAPVVGLFLLFSRFLFRETSYNSFGEFVDANDGMWNLLFGGAEISFAKMFAAVYTFSDELPRLSPLHGVLSGLVAPIPRALITSKPYGASALFTEYTSPIRWDLTKSETLISGYSELYWELGAIGACVAMDML